MYICIIILFFWLINFKVCNVERHTTLFYIRFSLEPLPGHHVFICEKKLKKTIHIICDEIIIISRKRKRRRRKRTSRWVRERQCRTTSTMNNINEEEVDWIKKKRHTLLLYYKIIQFSSRPSMCSLCMTDYWYRLTVIHRNTKKNRKTSFVLH